MPVIIEPPEPGAPLAPLWKRLAWFLGLAAFGTVAVAIVAYGLKAMLPAS